MSDNEDELLGAGAGVPVPKESESISEIELKVLDAFRHLGPVPVINSPLELKKWMLQYSIRESGFPTHSLTSEVVPPSLGEIKGELGQSLDNLERGAPGNVGNIAPVSQPTLSVGTTSPSALTSTATLGVPRGSQPGQPGLSSALPQGSIIVPQTPRLPTFSGGKSDARYDLWRYEVTSLCRHQPEAVVWEAIRRSMRGDAACVVMRLGPDATLQQLLSKFDSIYGNAAGAEAIMAELYNAKQGNKESVSDWSCRLEDLAVRAQQLGQLTNAQVDNTLRSRFWHGLRQEFRDRTAHKFDSLETFDELRNAIRQAEALFAAEGRDIKTASIKTQQTTNLEKEVQDLKQQLASILAKLDGPSHQPLSAQAPPYRPQRGQQAGRNFQGRPNFNGAPQQGSPVRYPSPRGPRPQAQRQPMNCWNCGELGHLRYQCNVRMDHSNRYYGPGNAGGLAPAWGQR